MLNSLIPLLLAIFHSFQAFAGAPAQGTIISLAEEDGSGKYVVSVYEETLSCPVLLMTYAVPVIPSAVVPVRMAENAQDRRAFVFGTAIGSGVPEVWIRDDLRRLDKQVSILDPVTIAPYSNQEVIVGSRNGDAFIVDGEGSISETLMLENHFEAGFPSQLIGDTVRVWRSGPDSISYLTQNHFVHSTVDRTTKLVLNATSPAASNAFIASFDLMRIRSGIGDDRFVWIVHETMPERPLSASLFDIDTGKFLIRHSFPQSFSKEDPVPGYFDSSTETAYFAVGDRWVSFTSKDIREELPLQQLAPSNLPMNGDGSALKSVLVSPPPQGMPWGDISGKWLAPGTVSRSTQGWQSVGRETPIRYNPEVIHSQRTPTRLSYRAVNEDPTLVKYIFGRNFTKAGFTVYLRSKLAAASDSSGQITPNQMVSVVRSLEFELRVAIMDLDDEKYLRPRGLQYANSSLQVVDNTKISSVADWAQILWDLQP